MARRAAGCGRSVWGGATREANDGSGVARTTASAVGVSICGGDVVSTACASATADSRTAGRALLLRLFAGATFLGRVSGARGRARPACRLALGLVTLVRFAVFFTIISAS